MNSEKIIDKTTSRLDRAIILFKDISIFGGFFLGFSLAIFYLFGIAIYATFTSMLGIAPFEFNLQNCLEIGAASFVEITTTLPMLIILGMADNFQEAGLAEHILFLLPLVLIFAYRTLGRYSGTTFKKIQKVVAWLLLFFMCFMYIVIYLTLFASYSTQNLLVDPFVNIALQHKEELLETMDFIKFGIQGWDGWTANIVLREDDWIFGKVGALYSIVGLFILYGIFTIKTYDCMLAEVQEENGSLSKLYVYSRRVFFGIFSIFVIGFLFVVPARTYVLSSLTSPKADVSIQGLEDLTSKYYLIVVGNYEHSYALYNPNKQNVIVVAKDKVNYIIFKNETSIFTDRRFFRKTSWLGVYGEWKYTQDQNVTEHKTNKIIGFEIFIVYPDSPAFTAKLMPGDIITKVGNTKVDGSQHFGEIIEKIPPNKSTRIKLIRNGKLITLKVKMDIFP